MEVGAFVEGTVHFSFKKITHTRATFLPFQKEKKIWIEFDEACFGCHGDQNSEPLMEEIEPLKNTPWALIPSPEFIPRQPEKSGSLAVILRSEVGVE